MFSNPLPSQSEEEFYRGLTPEQRLAYALDPRRVKARQMMQAGANTSPVQHWSQGLARLASAGIGAHLQNQALERFRQAPSGLSETPSDPNEVAAIGGAGNVQPQVQPSPTANAVPGQAGTVDIQPALVAAQRIQQGGANPQETALNQSILQQLLQRLG